jgi:type I restriction enzyme, S subunit
LGVKHSNVKLQNSGTVLLSFKLSIGRVAFAGVPLYTNEAIAGLNSKEIDLNFLFHGLHQWDLLQGVDQAIKGATLNKEKLKKITFEYPTSTVEQTKIAEILSTVDRAIEQTEALIAKQQRIKTGLMQDLLTRGIDEHGNLRSEQTHKFKDSLLGRIPVEWEEMKLSEATSKLITYGIVQPGGHVPDGVPFVQTKDLTRGQLESRLMDRTSHYIHAAYQRSAIHTGDIVIGIRASVGFVAEVPAELNSANISRGVARLSPSKRLLGRYLYWIVQAAHIQNSIKMEIKGSTYPEITLPALRNILIPVPNTGEQDKVAKSLDNSGKYIRHTEIRLTKLRSLKTALMQDLLTGKKRVTTLLNETETVH